MAKEKLLSTAAFARDRELLAARAEHGKLEGERDPPAKVLALEHRGEREGRSDGDQQRLARGADGRVAAASLTPRTNDEENEAAENKGGERAELDHSALEEPERDCRIFLVLVRLLLAFQVKKALYFVYQFRQ